MLSTFYVYVYLDGQKKEKIRWHRGGSNSQLRVYCRYIPSHPVLQNDKNYKLSPAKLSPGRPPSASNLGYL